MWCLVVSCILWPPETDSGDLPGMRKKEGNAHADIQGALLSLMIQFANYKRFPVQPKEG